MRQHPVHVPDAMTGPGSLSIRPAIRDDIPALREIARTAFNPPADWADVFEARFKAERVLVAVDGERPVGATTVIPMQQWFGGRALSTAGVAGVAVWPTARGAGIASSLMRESLERARAAGTVLSTLYPANVPLYRNLGYEYAGTFTTYRAPLAAFPAIPPGTARVTDLGEDPEPVIRSFRRLAAQENGLCEGLGDEWWPNRVLNGWRREPHGAVMTGEVTPDGYTAYAEEGVKDGWGYRLTCTHLVALTPAAAYSLMAHFRRFQGLAQEIEWHGPPVEPFALMLPEQAISRGWEFRFMSRILDVAGALTGRGYPEDIGGRASFSVRDPLFPDNDGTFVVEAEGGAVEVERDDAGAGATTVSIGALTALFTGSVTPAAAVRTGLVSEAGSDLAFLGRLFSGPTPWTLDFF